jgi:hypothetical protein
MRKNTKEKLEYLKSLGFINTETIDVEGYDTEFHFDYAIFYSIYEDEFEIGDSLQTILHKATVYSCCGDPLDRDIMICPTCKEHC